MNRRTAILITVVIVLILGVVFFLKKKNPVAETITAQQVYQKAVSYRNNRDYLKAKKFYKRILTESPDFDAIAKVQDELEDVNLKIITTNVESSQAMIHEVQSGDTLGKLAQKHGTTIELIKQRNDLKSDIIRVGQRLSVWTGKFSVFVDKSQNILMLKNNDEIVKTYTVSTGKDVSVTPVGKFTIVNKLVDPVWFNKGVVLPPESPANVLGTRWLGFDMPGYGIHGTTNPETIGSHETAGCVRMRNEDVEELYSLLTTGTEVVIVD